MIGKVHKYEARIELDGVGYRIGLYREDGSLVGCPVRGLTYQQAVIFQPAVNYAFGFGLREYKRLMNESEPYWELDLKPFDEDLQR